MSIVACSITRSSDSCQTKIFQNLKNINDNFSEKIELKLKTDNTTKGLSEYYNNCIDNYAKNCEYLIFVHDDVEFINMDLAYQIRQGMEKYDVLGVAGCRNPQIKEANLWHLMAAKHELCGFAGHNCSETGNELYVTSFGPSPSRVAFIDGVVMIVKSEKILKTKTRFDERFRFHHYDLDFSISCNLNKLKIGVWPILINHSSPGLREVTEEWKQSNEYFKQKWIKKLQKN
jgi:GT2 family glycosyltransferase